MNQTAMPPDQRLLQLLADRATEGIGQAETAELESLIGEHPDVDCDAFDLAAAAANVAYMQDATLALPTALRSRLLSDAEEFFVEPNGDEVTADFQFAAQLRATKPAQPRQSSPSAWFSWRNAGWYAAAAAILLAVLSWLPPGPVATSPTAADQRLALLQAGGDTVQIPWSVTAEGQSAYGRTTGDVVWSTTRQEGYMRLTGMPANEPSQTQYQLWIVDPTRDEFPIDGGVFDVTQDGEAIIPIDAKLAVNTPQAFAITLEKPGGVVRSAGPLLIVAANSR